MWERPHIAACSAFARAREDRRRRPLRIAPAGELACGSRRAEGVSRGPCGPGVILRILLFSLVSAIRPANLQEERHSSHYAKKILLASHPVGWENVRHPMI